MCGQLRKTLPRRLDIVNLEHEIQRMEADLECYTEKTRIFEETIHTVKNNITNTIYKKVRGGEKIPVDINISCSRENL